LASANAIYGNDKKGQDRLLRLRVLAFRSLQEGMRESAANNESPNLHPVFLCKRWNDTVQPKVLDKLSVVVGDVPDSNDRDAEFGARSGITTFDTVERIVCRERGQDAV
jgi:hypothetical protein